LDVARPPVEDRGAEDVVEDLVARRALAAERRDRAEDAGVSLTERLERGLDVRAGPLGEMAIRVRERDEVSARPRDRRARRRQEEAGDARGGVLLAPREPVHPLVEAVADELLGAAELRERGSAKCSRPLLGLLLPQGRHHDLE